MNNERTFEGALGELERIVNALESGNAPLDDSLALYEKAVNLVKFCNEKLDAAEQKVKVLTESEINDD